MSDLVQRLVDVVGAEHVLTDDAIGEDYTHDECLTVEWLTPKAVVRPGSTEDVVAIVGIASDLDVPIVARGTGTGLSGAAVPHPDGILVSFERMDALLEVDTDNHMAVVQPGITLDVLDEALAKHGLAYPVQPGEYSASLGGNVNTNAGGMRAVKYGVTRQHVLGVEAVLATGEVIRSGGKIVKTSTGYDLTQLFIGSEGTLGLITEITLRLQPRPAKSATVLAPFETLDQVTDAVPKLVASGLEPSLLEYIDFFTMAAITQSADLELGVPAEIKDKAQAYLVIAIEDRDDERLDGSLTAIGELAFELGAMDLYVLPSQAANQLIEAREKAFWVAKAAGCDDIVDVVVPRASIQAFLEKSREVAAQYESLVVGCGHAGDGNVHLSVFQKDPDKRKATMKGLFAAGMELGGAITGEHGLGTAKQSYFLDLEDPAKIALLRRIKAAFDPQNILNPGKVIAD